ncbi:MAG: cupin domain-containing protein [Burkholderiales bacterium]
MNAPERVTSTFDTPYARRARYFSDDNGFTFRWPPVPVRQFLTERDRAFDASTATGLIALDSSDALGTPYPATTPALLLRYLKIRAGEEFGASLNASGEIYYVISGKGESRNGSDSVDWGEGDLFLFGGGGETVHRAVGGDCLLYLGTDEPLLAYDGLRAPELGKAKVETTHWPATEIERRLESEWRRPLTGASTGRFVQFASEALAPSNNTLPLVIVGLNTLAVGCDQRAHRHNGVAVTLALQGEGTYSMIDGQRVDWSTGAVQITPPTTLHSHHNRGAGRMRALIFQDEALHYYTRTPGFSFD